MFFCAFSLVMAPYFRKVCAIFGCDFFPGVEELYYSFPTDVPQGNNWIHGVEDLIL